MAAGPQLNLSTDFPATRRLPEDKLFVENGFPVSGVGAERPEKFDDPPCFQSLSSSISLWKQLGKKGKRVAMEEMPGELIFRQ